MVTVVEFSNGSVLYEVPSLWVRPSSSGGGCFEGTKDSEFNRFALRGKWLIFSSWLKGQLFYYIDTVIIQKIVRLYFSTLVSSVRLYFEVDYVSGATIFNKISKNNF